MVAGLYRDKRVGRGKSKNYRAGMKGGTMNEQLKRLETEIFYDRKLRRIAEIREAWAAYVKTLEPKDTMGRRAIAWICDIVGK